MSEKGNTVRKILMGVLVLFIGLTGCTKDEENNTVRDTSVYDEGATSGDEADSIARVGDERITSKDVEMILSQIPAQYRPRYSTAEGRRELVEAIVGMKMLAWDARRRGIDEQPDVRIKLDYMIDQTLARALEEEVRGSVRVKDRDIEKYYNENREKYHTPAKVKARHILVDTGEEAEKILEEIRGGADFAELARKKSKCPSADKGGDLGWFEKGKMDPAFEKAAFGLEKGGLSGVVKSSFGYHIIKVENTKAARTKSLDQARTSIEKTLTRQLVAEEMAALKDRIRDEASVTVNEGYFSSFETGEQPSGGAVQDRAVPEAGQGG